MSAFGSNFAGAGAMAVDSLAVAGAISAASVAAATVDATTALTTPLIRTTTNVDIAFQRNSVEKAKLTTKGWTMSTGAKLVLDSAETPTDNPLQFNGAAGTGFRYNSPNQFVICANGSLMVNVSTAGMTVLNGGVNFPEASTPAAIANTAVLFALDVAGKTQLASRMPTGAAIPIVTEA